MAALERARRRRDVVRGRVRRHRGEGDRGSACAACSTDEYLLAYSQPILDQRRGRSCRRSSWCACAAQRDPGRRPVARRASSRRPSAAASSAWSTGGWSAHAVALSRQGRRAEVNLSARLDRGRGVHGRASSSGSAAPVSTAGNIVFEITETAALEHLDAGRRLRRPAHPARLPVRPRRLRHRLRLADPPAPAARSAYLKIDTSFVRDVSLRAARTRRWSGASSRSPGSSASARWRRGSRTRHARAGQRLRRRLRAGLPHRPPGTGGLTNPARAAVQLRRRKVAASIATAAPSNDTASAATFAAFYL